MPFSHILHICVTAALILVVTRWRINSLSPLSIETTTMSWTLPFNQRKDGKVINLELFKTFRVVEFLGEREVVQTKMGKINKIVFNLFFAANLAKN